MIEREMEDLIAAHAEEFFPRHVLVLQAKRLPQKTKWRHRCQARRSIQQTENLLSTRLCLKSTNGRKLNATTTLLDSFKWLRREEDWTRRGISCTPQACRMDLQHFGNATGWTLPSKRTF